MLLHHRFPKHSALLLIAAACAEFIAAITIIITDEKAIAANTAKLPFLFIKAARKAVMDSDKLQLMAALPICCFSLMFAHLLQQLSVKGHDYAHKPYNNKACQRHYKSTFHICASFSAL